MVVHGTTFSTPHLLTVSEGNQYLIIGTGAREGYMTRWTN